jgi:hypothetical protein
MKVRRWKSSSALASLWPNWGTRVFCPTCNFFYFGIGSNDPSGNVVLEEITAVSSVPLPAALPLFATGVGVLGLLGWRRKKTAAG